MALTTEQKASRLFKKSLGLAETQFNKKYFEDASYVGYTRVLPSQIWAQSIPATAPGFTTETVQWFETPQAMSYITGSDSDGQGGDTGSIAFYLADLTDMVPKSYDETYAPTIYQNNGTQIPLGDGDWIIDAEAGVLTFYGDAADANVSSDSVPKISFYKYIGEKGLSSGTTSGTGVGITVKDPVLVASTVNFTTYDTVTSGYTFVPDEIDGITGSTFIEEDRILIRYQTEKSENGIFQVSGLTLARAVDSDGTTGNEVSINDYVFVLSGTSLISSSWIIGDTDAVDNTNIDISFETQHWKLFATGTAYTADGEGIELIGSQFSLELNETGGSWGSGLDKGSLGLTLTGNVQTALSLTETNSTSIATNVVDITTNVTNISTNVVDIATNVTNISSNVVDIATNVTNISSNVVDIATNSTSITTLNTSISTNTLNISSNVVDIATNITNISSNVVDISTNSTSITTLNTSISTNTLNISTNTLGVSTNTVDISTNSTSITTLNTSISTNTLNISTNVVNISSNVVDIATNTGGVSSNVVDIAVNSSNIEELSGLTIDLSGAAGSGLTYVESGITYDATLNVKVDDWSIKIDPLSGLTGTKIWVQPDTDDIIGISALTSLSLTFDPVGYVSAYINGLEYLISGVVGSSADNQPFYFNSIPGSGSILGFDPVEAGFDLVASTDWFMVKYYTADDITA